MVPVYQSYTFKSIQVKSCTEWIIVAALFDRLCQNIALLKAEISELLFPSVIVSLAGRIGTDINLHDLITSQVSLIFFGYINSASFSYLLALFLLWISVFVESNLLLLCSLCLL